MFFSRKINKKMSILKEIDASLYEYIHSEIQKHIRKNIYYLSSIIILFILNVLVAIASFNNSVYNHFYYKIITISFLTFSFLCILFFLIIEIRKECEKFLSDGFLSYEKIKEMNVIYNIRDEKQMLGKNLETKNIVEKRKRL